MIEKTLIINGHRYTLWCATEEELNSRIANLEAMPMEELDGDDNI